MKVRELVRQLEDIEAEHGNIEVVKSDYELGPAPISEAETSELNPLIIDEDTFESEEGEKVARI